MAAVMLIRSEDGESGMCCLLFVSQRSLFTRKEGDPWPVNIGTMGCPRGETCAGLATRTAPSVTRSNRRLYMDLVQTSLRVRLSWNQQSAAFWYAYRRMTYDD